MSNSNVPDPHNIPDMSLGDRGEKPAPAPAHAFEVPSSYQAPPPSEPAPTLRKEKPPAAPEWQEGDRVLAPWEPMFLYSGTIKQIRIDDAKGDQALIDFDDGDEGWVYLFSMSTIELDMGQKVLSRHRMGPDYYPGTIAAVDGEEVEVAFEDGGEEWTTVAALRIPCVENSPGAVGTKFNASRPPGMGAPAGGGVPTWVYTVGLIILIFFLRVGCRAMQ